MTPFLITLLAPRAPPATEGGEKREPITELMTDLCYPIHPWDVSDESGNLASNPVLDLEPPSPQAR